MGEDWEPAPGLPNGWGDGATRHRLTPTPTFPFQREGTAGGVKPYQLALRTPGSRPFRAISLKQMRHNPKWRM